VLALVGIDGEERGPEQRLALAQVLRDPRFRRVLQPLRCIQVRPLDIGNVARVVTKACLRVGEHRVELAAFPPREQVVPERLEEDGVVPPAFGVVELPRSEIVRRVDAATDEFVRLVREARFTRQPVRNEAGQDRVRRAATGAVIRGRPRVARESRGSTRQPAEGRPGTVLHVDHPLAEADRGVA
jgi:hypothetical protein